MTNRTKKILSFLQEIEKMKTIQRKILISSLDRGETDAEHTWHVAMFLMLFYPDLPKELDFIRMIKMIMIHDLVEIVAGDTFPFDKDEVKTKKDREMQAAKELFSKLPKDLENEFWELFNEFENAETDESKFVQSFDKIQPVLQNLSAKGESWKELGLTYDQIFNYKIKTVSHNDLTKEIFLSLLDEAVEKGWLTK